MLPWLRARPGVTEQFAQLARAEAFGPRHDDIALLCISLRSAGARLKTIRYAMRDSGRFEHVEGVYGRDLPRAAIGWLSRDLGKGQTLTTSEVGCTLSHVKAWERVAETASRATGC